MKVSKDLDGEEERLPKLSIGGKITSWSSDLQTSWNTDLQVTARDIARSRRRRAVSAGERSGSPVNPDFMSPSSNPRFGKADLSPSSIHSGSSSNRFSSDLDELSICNQIDYGYTAAIRFHPAWSASQADTSSELSGMGNQFQDKDNSIRDALANSIDEHLQGIEESDHVWLPINRLPEIINEKSVRSALEEAFKEDFPPTGSLTDKVESRAAKICKVYTHDMKGQHDEETETSLRRIFAILILLDRVRDISLFLNAGLADIDLPFNVQREVEGVRLTSHLSEEKRCVLGLGGQGHKARKLAEDFRFIQNQVFTPFFDFKVDGREIPFFHLPPKSTLPFIKIHHHEGSEGGYSTVFRVQIDPAHHNLKINPIRSTSKFDRLDASTSVRTGEGGPESNPPTHPSASSLEEAEYYNPEWALKRINKIGGKGLDTTVVRDEINSLVKASCGFESGHVIKLFATYHRNGQWYLLFPWAEDDLLAFWEKEDPRKSSLGPLPLVTWIASQCRGLATGLRQIHRCRSSHGEWGIHRDIKPTNILRFRREKMFWLPGEPTEGDQLVISDLGFTRFHSKDSRSKAIMTGGSPCYMGPEYHGCISRAYDIWSLACVYIEFITWYIVGGSKGRDHFSQLRRHWTTRDGQNFTEDKYFYFEPESKTAKLVPAVALWIRYLRSLDRCSDFFHDFLQLIEDKMLVIDPNMRISASKLMGELGALIKTCKVHGEGYCATGNPKKMEPEQKEAFERLQKSAINLCQSGYEYPYAWLHPKSPSRQAGDLGSPEFPPIGRALSPELEGPFLDDSRGAGKGKQPMTYPDHSFSGQRGRQTLRSQEQPWTPTPARRTSVPDAGTDEPAYESEEHDTIPDPPSFWQICETWMNLVVDWFSSIWTRVWDWLVVDGYVDAALTEPLLRR